MRLPPDAPELLNDSRVEALQAHEPAHFHSRGAHDYVEFVVEIQPAR
ncbi:hypothetical protein [Peristeroidobacter soli]|nr:hypothetical protein [Peristeroidobacter soli]